MAHKKLKPVLLLGSGNFAEDIADIIGECPDWYVDGVVDSFDSSRAGSNHAGGRVYWIDEIAEYSKTHYAIGAVGTTKRRKFIEKVISFGLSFATVVHPTAHVSKNSKLEPGVLVSRGSQISCGSTIKGHVLINRSTTIGHHVEIDEYSTIGPGVNIASSVRIGAGTYIGIGATIIDRLSIGKGSIIAAGAVVTKDVPDRVLVAGVPARIIKRDVAPL